jgi:hypothetical protein
MRFTSKVSMLFLLLAVLAVPGLASAEEPKTFGVLPFTVNGPDKYRYYSRGIQDMLVSRLYVKDRFLPVDKAVLAKITAPVSESQGLAILSDLGLDYLVWGSLTVMGEDTSLDVRILGQEGGIQPKNAQAKLSGLIPALEQVAADIGIGTVAQPAPAPETASTKKKSAMNPALVHNEVDRTEEFYLNPEFRYAGSAEMAGRLRSQRLPFQSIGMAVGDADADGKNEVFFLADHKVYAYSFEGQTLRLLAEYETARTLQCLQINVLDLNKDGFQEIVVSAVEADNAPKSFILNFKNNAFEVVAERIYDFLGVVNQPPFYKPTLVGQKKGDHRLFADDVRDVDKMSGEYRLGRKLLLPKDSNVFNVTYLPYKDDYKVVVTDSRDFLRVYTPTGDRQYRSPEGYSGGSVGLTYYKTMPGLGTSPSDEPYNYYIPLRAITVDLDNDGKYELLVNRPISTAATFFQRYRYYPQGEIHALFWDGVGLNLRWKTRRIKGSIADFSVADVDNDGVKDLVVCVNTHPGVSGVEHRRTMILAYPLETRMIGDTKVDKAFREE